MLNSRPQVKTLLFLALCLCGSRLELKAQSAGSADVSPFGLKIREVRIQGLHNVREQIVRDQLASREGQLYTEKTAANDVRGLDRLGCFSSSRITPTLTGSEVTLNVEVQELIRILPYPSINVTGENGVSAGLGVKVPSLLGRAIALSGAARFGPLTEFELIMQSPWWARQRTWFDWRYNYRDRPNESDHFREHANEFEFRAGAKYRQNLRLGGRFAFISLTSDTPGITLATDSRDNTPALGALLEYDGRNLRSNPHKGWQTFADLSQNGGWLGGDGNFRTAQFDLRRYQPLAARHVLAFFSFATFQSGVVGKDVPLYRNYHIGGTNSVRGWKPNARQGNNQFLNTLEYRYELMAPKSFRVRGFGFYIGVNLAAFADLGTSWDRGSEFARNMIGGGGFGIRLLVPVVDMIRIDFGFGQSGEGILSHFGLREKAEYSRLRVR
jgi:outer membrane protein insertion porin family